MVSESIVVEIVDNLREASIDNFVEILRDGNEDAIKELFKYSAVEFLSQINGREDEYRAREVYGYFEDTFLSKLFIEIETAEYSVDKTTSLLSPYEAKISCHCYVLFYYLGTDTRVNIREDHEEDISLSFLYNEDALRWEYREGEGDPLILSYIEAEMNRFDTIQDELIARGSQ